MKHNYVAGPAPQVKSRPRKAGPFSIPVRQTDTGYFRPNSPKLGSQRQNTERIGAESSRTKIGPNPRGIAAPAPRIRLDRLTSARLAHIVQLIGIPAPELIDTVLQQLLSGSALDSLVHSGGYPQSLPDRGAFTCIGWQAGGIPAVPTVADLLPLDVLEKFLGVWVATGANVLYTGALGMLATLATRGPEAAALVADTLEGEIIERVNALRDRWEGGLSK